ncbi:MAG: arginase family protein [Nanoarchaeota archaeon]|nr:arginase family protein [Nanoarchaeota archaeon]MBU1631829.1 arginase family protein [Nanoarchaeota archaeon]MBU1876102.1 arginase family protein [Nanoarchaeota archaeon]
MPKFAYHNCNKITDADIILVGVPDESGSYAERRGTKKGPDAIREASHERLCFKRKGKTFCVESENGPFNLKLFDAGNISKPKIQSFLESISKEQMTILLGGDHSNTYLAVKALSKKYKELAIIHLDAHPDLISSTKYDFGSVINDILSLKEINHKKAIQIGIRAIEPEEEINLKREKINFFTALDVYEMGVQKVFSSVKKIIGDTPIYLSIDLDVLDPAFAPGVDTPAPFGLTGNEYLSLVKKIASLNLIGFDLMEMNPKYDVQQLTAQIAAQSIIEILGTALPAKRKS